MKRKIKLFIVIIIIIIQNLCLTGCWNSREINSLAFMTSMGFDKTENGILMTVQVLNPRAIASQKSVNEAPVVVYTEEGKDAVEIIRKMITQSPRKLNGTHLQTVIFGEEFAKDGISAILDLFSREHQNRNDLYFAVAKGSTANKVLNCLTKLETNPSVKLYTSINASDQVWAGSNSVKVIQLINTIISDGDNPALTGVEIIDDSKENDSIDILKETKADAIQLMDLAVFKKDKFVGWLNENESKGYKYIIGEIKSTMGYVEDEGIGKITLEVTDTKTKQKAFLSNEKPTITVEINIDANIETVEGNLDITKDENIKKIEKLAEDKVTRQCYKTIEKLQKELNSDIFGFGDVVHRTYPKLWKTMKYNWDKEFINLPVEVNVNCNIKGTGTISKSFFMKEKEEK